MKCPLRYGIELPQLGPLNATTKDCLNEECAWWDPRWGWCIEQTKAHALHTIATELWKIRQKMPHVEQFKR